MDSTTPGAMIGGRYRLVERVGSGGMGAVWRGVDEVLHRTVAIKEVIAPPELSPDERRLLRERTLREARAAARMTSPHVVTVYDVVAEGDRPWIVMEWLEAPTLAEVIRERGALARREVAEVGLSLVSALRAAHLAGVLHRDVKPSNVMLTEAGAVLTDFGIASAEGDPSLTTTGILIGSPSFMPPERVQGEPATAASDLWSLGATLYAAVEGTSPFERQGQLPTLHAVVYEDPPDPTRAGPLAPVLLALLDKNPGQRPDLDATEAMLSDALVDRAAVPPPAPAPVSAYGVRYPEGEHAQALPFLLAPDDTDEPAPPRRSWTPMALATAAFLLITALGATVLVNALKSDPGVGSTTEAGIQRPTRTAGDRPDGNNDPAESPTANDSPNPSTTAPSTPKRTPSPPSTTTSPVASGVSQF